MLLHPSRCSFRFGESVSVSVCSVIALLAPVCSPPESRADRMSASLLINKYFE